MKTRIVGTIMSGNSMLNGWVQCIPSSPIVDLSTYPSIVVLGGSDKFPITDGVLEIQLVPSNQTTYQVIIGRDKLIEAAKPETTVNGTTTPATPAVYQDEVLTKFYCLIPETVTQIDIKELLPVPYRIEHDGSMFRIIDALKSNREFKKMLTELFSIQGTWVSGYYYPRLSIVLYQGKSYISKNNVSGTSTPNLDIQNWQAIN